MGLRGERPCLLAFPKKFVICGNLMKPVFSMSHRVRNVYFERSAEVPHPKLVQSELNGYCSVNYAHRKRGNSRHEPIGCRLRYFPSSSSFVESP